MSDSDVYNQAHLAYNKSVAAFWVVIADSSASDAQVSQARAAAEQAQNTFEGVVLADFDQRTLLLNNLIGLLEGVISSVQPNPIGTALDDLNGALTMVSGLLAQPDAGGGDTDSN